MDKAIEAVIRAIRPKRSLQKRWKQYGEVTRRLFPMVPQSGMDEICRAVADKLRL